MGEYETEFRDNINKWFENTLASINNKKVAEKNEKNQVRNMNLFLNLLVIGTFIYIQTIDSKI